MTGPVFGDMSFAIKGLLHQSSAWAVSAGVQCAVPTAPAMTFTLTNGNTLAQVSNNSIHAMPFLGYLYTPDDRFFAQGFLQVDVDTNGNRVYANPVFTSSAPLISAGRLQDPTFL